MWFREYKDYPIDASLVKQRVESGKGIVGCEMHELNGWGHTYHISRKEWRQINDAKRRTQLGNGDSIPPVPKMPADH